MVMPMRSLIIILLAGILAASPAAQAGGKSRPRSLWDEPAGIAVITLFPIPDSGHRRERPSGRRELSLWDERPAPLQPASATALTTDKSRSGVDSLEFPDRPACPLVIYACCR